MPINYVQGDLFKAAGGVLAHACNCHGVWGGGIASIFKRKFPEAYAAYAKHCQSHSPEQLLGSCYSIPAGKYRIACLFTSDGNSVPEIVRYTRLAVEDLKNQIGPAEPIQMPQINAGIFGVPWEATEVESKKVDAPITVYRL